MHFFRKPIAILLVSLVTISLGKPFVPEKDATESDSNEVLQSLSTPEDRRYKVDEGGYEAEPSIVIRTGNFSPAPHPPLKDEEIGRVMSHWCVPGNSKIVIKFVNTYPPDESTLKCQPVEGEEKTFEHEAILWTVTMCRFPVMEIQGILEAQKGNGETVVKLNVPFAFDDTETRVKVLPIGSSNKSEILLEDLGKLIDMSDSQDDFVAAVDASCLPDGSAEPHDLVVAVVNQVDTEPLPVALASRMARSVPCSKQDDKIWNWFSISLFSVVCVLLSFIFRRQILKAAEEVNRQNLASWWQAITSYVKTMNTCTSQPRTISQISNYDDETSEVIALDAEADSFSQPVSVQDFEDYVRRSIANAALRAQFKMLPRGSLKDTGCGSLPQNKPKNRYPNILPYDETRVILKKIPGEPYSDYINANYFLDIDGKKGYIATQGPKTETVDDFWRMVWQERSRVICMLANVVEGKKSKCTQYWPNYGESATYGDITVLTESHRVLTDYTSRTFLVSHGEKSRRVEHLHHTTWPDHSVPKYSRSVIAYLRKLQTLPIGNGPIIVHCSAGVGRTGTIILCDICSRQAVATGYVDVLAEVKKLRDCRMNMVSNEAQYLFAHLVLAEALVSVPTALPLNQSFSLLVEEQKTELSQHMERLCNTAWQDHALKPRPLARPLLPEQLKKNRFPDLAPDGSHLVYLKRYPPRDVYSDYISAVVVDGLKEKTYLASQLPMPSTISDFWRLVAEQRVEFIIILQQPDPEDPTCCDIIPADEPLKPVPYLHVELTTCSRLHSNRPKIDKLLLRDTSGSEPREQEVTVLTCREWGKGENGKPPLPLELVEFWMRSETVHQGTGPTLVLCHDGVTGCGLYLALSFLMDHIAVDRECDVLHAIRAIRRSRPEFVRSREQAVYLYDAVKKYVEQFEIYTNVV